MKQQSNYFVRNIPEIEEREFKYRTKMDSHELNKMQKEAFTDILDLFNKANALQKNLYEFNMTNDIETSVYSKRLTEVLIKLKQTEELYNNLKSADTDFRYQTRFAYEAEVFGDGYKSVVDKTTNDIRANIVSSISKTRIYNDTYDEILVPNSIQAYIGPDSFGTGGSIYSIEDSEINNIFDNTNNNVWYRKVVTSIDVNEIENEIVIRLPEDIVTTRLVNEIVVHPFPIGHEDVMDILYKTNGAWTRIPGFDTYHDITEETYHDIFNNEYKRNVILNANNMRFNFKSVQMNQIKIKLRQRNYEYDSVNNRRIFYLGLRNVDVLYNKYTTDNSIFAQTFDFPETDKLIKIYDVEPVYNNTKSNGKDFNVTKEYYYFDNANNYHKISGSIPFVLTGHKMLVKFYIEGNEETPNIYMTKVKYKLD